ncbi:MAG: acyl-CoA thioesterase [Propylenella sp.]
MHPRQEEAESAAHPPYVHAIDVRWSDCDPARIAYTGRIPGFALDAIDAWWADAVGHDWYRMNLDRNIGTPFVHLDIDFRAPVTPRHPLLCEVALTRVGRRSCSFRVVGRQDGRVCFEGAFVSAFVIADEFKPIDVPAEFVEKISRLVAEAPR